MWAIVLYLSRFLRGEDKKSVNSRMGYTPGYLIRIFFTSFDNIICFIALTRLISIWV